MVADVDDQDDVDYEECHTEDGDDQGCDLPFEDRGVLPFLCEQTLLFLLALFLLIHLPNMICYQSTVICPQYSGVL